MEHKTLTFGQKTSDFFAKIFKSWPFVIFQLFFIAVWIFLHFMNVGLDTKNFDVLKLILTIEASFMGSMLLMSQSRQSEQDRKIAYRDFQLDQKMIKTQKIELKKLDILIRKINNK